METFGHAPTEEQSRAVSVFSCFMASRELRPAMVLCGSAGTGKTSLTAAMVKTLVGLRQRVVLLAPTGRAAKVLSMNAGIPAFTIHRRIYRQKTFTGDMTGFNLNFNKQRDTLFVVDEASMISNDSFSGGAGQFGRLSARRPYGICLFRRQLPVDACRRPCSAASCGRR